MWEFMTKAGGMAVLFAAVGVAWAGDGKAKPATILESASAAGQFKTLLTAVRAAGLEETLNGTGPFTVFAPTDEAFAKLPKGTLEGLLKDKAKLTGILTFHVVPGKMGAAEVAKAQELKTLQGQSLTVDTTSGVKVSGANVVKPDVPATNGVIHVIDTVVAPN